MCRLQGCEVERKDQSPQDFRESDLPCGRAGATRHLEGTAREAWAGIPQVGLGGTCSDAWVGKTHGCSPCSLCHAMNSPGSRGTPRRVDRSVVPSEFHTPVRWGWVCRVPGSLERGPVALRDLCSTRGVMGSPQAPRERPRGASIGGPRAEVSSSGARAGEKTFYHLPRCGPCSPVGQVNLVFRLFQHQNPFFRSVTGSLGTC